MKKIIILFLYSTKKIKNTFLLQVFFKHIIRHTLELIYNDYFKDNYNIFWFFHLGIEVVLTGY